MSVRRLLALAFALLALLSGAGCGGNPTVLGPETDDPTFVEGRQLKRVMRNSEALNAFRKVIERRGPRESPESHLEAGQLYLEHAKDPIEAIHHFKMYLELQPNSAQTRLVRDLIHQATKNFAATVPGRIDQSINVSITEDYERVRRENEELKAEIATLRGGGATPVYRPPPTGVQLPLNNSRAQSGTVAEPSAAPVARVVEDRPVLQPAPSSVAPARGPTAAPARGPATRPAPAATGRTHTIRQSEGLFAIARQYDPKNPAAKMQQIIDANPDVLPEGIRTAIKPGMVLRIP